MTVDGGRQYPVQVAQRWDELVSWQDRLEHDAWLFELISANASAGARILDLATGTGFHLVELARRKFEVVGIDASAAMLDRCADHIARIGVEAELRHCSWADLPSLNEGEPFALAYALGSSIPHINDSEDRVRFFADLRSVLRDDGVLVVDHRNFDYIARHGRIPPAPAPYLGSVTVDVAHSDGLSTTFSYTYSDGFENRLTVASVRFAQVRDELNCAGYHVNSFADGSPASAIGLAAFGVHVGRVGTSLRS